MNSPTTPAPRCGPEHCRLCSPELAAGAGRDLAREQTPKKKKKKSCSIIIGKPGFRSLGKCQKGKRQRIVLFLHQSPISSLDHHSLSTKGWMPWKEGKSNYDPEVAKEPLATRESAKVIQHASKEKLIRVTR